MSFLTIPFMCFHFWDAYSYWGNTTIKGDDSESSLTKYQLDAYEAISNILQEDRIPKAEQWAKAIIQHSPTSDIGYLALIMAQIRRESRFNAPDLEWLFDRVVPESTHEMGLEDPISTIGPMQIKKSHLEIITEQPDQTKLKNEASEIDRGVQIAVVFLDEIVNHYYPSRQIKGWASLQGQKGYTVTDQANQIISLPDNEFDDLQYKASFQKMLSDLTQTPQVLDGVAGPKTLKACRKFSTILAPDEQRTFIESLQYELITLNGNSNFIDSYTFKTVKREWETIFGTSRDKLFPRLSNDPKLVFVFADFNVRKYSCRLAALQHMLAKLLELELTTDGIYGPETKSVLTKSLEILDLKENEYDDFIKLIENPGSKRLWLILRMHHLIGNKWIEKYKYDPPFALLPEVYTHRVSQKIKGIPRMSVKDYVIGSTAFYEDYYARLVRKMQ